MDGQKSMNQITWVEIISSEFEIIARWNPIRENSCIFNEQCPHSVDRQKIINKILAYLVTYMIPMINFILGSICDPNVVDNYNM